MTPQELRNGILQLAMQGKLVEQRVEEGTAAELYHQIRKEKAKLVKIGKIKKEQPLPEIAEDETPYDIPESWKWVYIESITYLVGNKNNQVQTKEIRKKGKYAVVSQGQNLIDGYSDSDDKVISDLPLVMFGDHTRNVKYIDFEFIIGADGTKFHKCILVNPKFVYYWMKYAVVKMKNRGYARHYSILKSICFSLPPLEEQSRIVAKIEELLSLVDHYAEAYNTLEVFNKKFPEDMRKSILQYAMQGRLVEQRAEEGTAEELLVQIKAEKDRLIKEGEIKKEKPLPAISENEIPFEIPESWKWVRFQHICKVLTCGYASTPSYVSSNEGKPFISAKNVKPYKFLPDDHKYISTNLYNTLTKICKPERNDILLTRVGAGIGEAAIIDIDMEFAIYVSLTLIKLVDNGLLYNKFILYWLNSPIGVSTARKNIYGKDASQGNLNVNNVRNYLFPLPPLEEQKRIVAKIEELLPCCERLSTLIDALR